MVLYNVEQFVADQVKPALLNDFTEELEWPCVFIWYMSGSLCNVRARLTHTHTRFSKVQPSLEMENKQKSQL